MTDVVAIREHVHSRLGREDDFVRKQIVNKFDAAWLAAEERIGLALRRSPDWADAAWAAHAVGGVSGHDMRALIDQAAWRITHGTLDPGGAYSWVRGAFRRIAVEAGHVPADVLLSPSRRRRRAERRLEYG